MFSLGKILLVALVAVAVYAAYRRFSAPRRDIAPQPQERPPEPASSAGGTAVAEDLEKCPVCGVYAARGTARCGRDKCPQR